MGLMSGLIFQLYIAVYPLQSEAGQRLCAQHILFPYLCLSARYRGICLTVGLGVVAMGYETSLSRCSSGV